VEAVCSTQLPQSGTNSVIVDTVDQCQLSTVSTSEDGLGAHPSTGRAARPLKNDRLHVVLQR